MEKTLTTHRCWIPATLVAGARNRCAAVSVGERTATTRRHGGDAVDLGVVGVVGSVGVVGVVGIVGTRVSRSAGGSVAGGGTMIATDMIGATEGPSSDTMDIAMGKRFGLIRVNLPC